MAELSSRQEILTTLSIAEAGAIQVGVPWLFPTKRVRQLRARFDGDLDLFLRVNLVGVKTQDLIQFRDALFDPTLYDVDSLPPLTPIERHGLSFLTVTVITLAVCGLSHLSPIVIPSPSSAVAIVGGVAALCSVTLSSDEHRRTSLGATLEREIKRRAGTPIDSSNNLQVCPSGG